MPNYSLKLETGSYVHSHVNPFAIGGGAAKIGGITELGAQPRDHVTFTIGSPSFVLTADAGAYVIAGTAANLEYGRTVTADSGSYVIRGTPADLKHGSLTGASKPTVGRQQKLRTRNRLKRELPLFELERVTKALIHHKTLVADPGNYGITGSPARFTIQRVTQVPLRIDRIGRAVQLEAETIVGNIKSTSGKGLYHRIFRVEPVVNVIRGSDAILYKIGTTRTISPESIINSLDFELMMLSTDDPDLLESYQELKNRATLWEQTPCR